MQKATVKRSTRKLELKKTSIAHLSLNEKQLQAVVGGANDTHDRETSAKIFTNTGPDYTTDPIPNTFFPF